MEVYFCVQRECVCVYVAQLTRKYRAPQVMFITNRKIKNKNEKKKCSKSEKYKYQNYIV